MKYRADLAAVVVAGAMLVQTMCAQENGRVVSSVATERTFFLKNSQSAQDQSEMVTALRNAMDPSVRIFAAYSQGAILVVGNAEQLELAGKLVGELDRPRRMYRLTYTLTDLDGGKRVGVQHFAVVVAAGQRTQLKQGNRVPLVTGTVPVAGAGPVTPSTQITYIDVGLNVDATVDPLDNGVALKTKVEVSGVAGDMTSALAQDPVLRQTTLEGTAVLQLGRPAELGSLDVLGSTRHTEVEVVAELVK